MFDGWLSFGGAEIVNRSRVQAYIENMLPSLKTYHVCSGECACDTLAALLEDKDYTTPMIDDAPWTDIDRPESFDFLGVYPLGITGLNDSTVTATVLDSMDDGGWITNRRRRPREVRVSVATFAMSDAAANYGTQWLKSVLDGACSDGCTTHDQLCFLTECVDPAEFQGITRRATHNVAEWYLFKSRWEQGKLSLRERTSYAELEVRGSCGDVEWELELQGTAGDQFTIVQDDNRIDTYRFDGTVQTFRATTMGTSIRLAVPDVSDTAEWGIPDPPVGTVVAPIPVSASGEGFWTYLDWGAPIPETANEYWVGSAPRLSSIDETSYGHIGPSAAFNTFPVMNLAATPVPDLSTVRITARVRLTGNDSVDLFLSQPDSTAFASNGAPVSVPDTGEWVTIQSDIPWTDEIDWISEYIEAGTAMATAWSGNTGPDETFEVAWIKVDILPPGSADPETLWAHHIDTGALIGTSTAHVWDHITTIPLKFKVVKVTSTARFELTRSECSAEFYRYIKRVANTEGPRVQRADYPAGGGVITYMDFVLTSETPWIYGNTVTAAAGTSSGIAASAVPFRVVRLSENVPECDAPPDSALLVDPKGPITPAPPRAGKTKATLRDSYEFSSTDQPYALIIPKEVVPQWLSVVPIVRITAGSADVRYISVRFFPIPFDSIAAQDIDPCSQCGSFEISYIPKGTTFVVDGTEEYASVVTSGGVEQDAQHLVTAPGGVGAMTWPALSCGVGYMVIVDSHDQNLGRIQIDLAVRE